MRIEDRFIVLAPHQDVWQAITDPAVMVPCVPGCEGVTVVSPTQYLAHVRVQLGPIKADFNLEVEVIEERPPVEIRSRTRGEEGGRASTLSAENLLTLNRLAESETEVSYASEVSVVGRLGKFGLGVMKKKAESLGRDFAVAFKRKLESGERAA